MGISGFDRGGLGRYAGNKAWEGAYHSCLRLGIEVVELDLQCHLLAGVRLEAWKHEVAVGLVYELGEENGRCSKVGSSNRHNCPAAAPEGIVVSLIQGRHMDCFDNLARAASSVQSPHMNCSVIDCCLVAVKEEVACCRTAHFEAGNCFGLILEAAGLLLVVRRVASAQTS